MHTAHARGHAAHACSTPMPPVHAVPPCFLTLGQLQVDRFEFDGEESLGHSSLDQNKFLSARLQATHTQHPPHASACAVAAAALCGGIASK